MLTFKEFLIEERKNPSINKKLSAYEQLKKYKNDPNIYISYTVLKKLGVNPQSKWSTPMGIYAYPLLEIWPVIENMKSASAVPFAGDSPYIHVIKYNGTGNLIEISKYNNFNNDIKKLKLLYTSLYENTGLFNSIDAVINKASNKSFVKSDFGKLWNITRTIADDMIYTKNHSSTESKNWNTIWRKLGYTGVADKKGSGIIHQSESTQAVFFSKKDITVIDMILNKNYYPITRIDNKNISKHLPDLLKTYSLNRIFNTITKNEKIIGHYTLNNITVNDIIYQILKNLDFYISREDKNIDLYVALKFNDINGFKSTNEKSLIYKLTKLYFNKYSGDELPDQSQVELTANAISHYYGDLLDTLHINENHTSFYNNTYSIFEWIYSKV